MVVRIDDKDKYFAVGDKFFVILNRGCRKSDFLKAAQVMAGSYAEELMGRVYDCLVTYAVDIREECQKYYSDEYSDLETFLYWKYNVDRVTATKIVGSLKPADFLGYGSVYSGGDYVLGQFIMSDTGLEMVNRILNELREVNGEDQN
jgi:hypothetical protein